MELEIELLSLGALRVRAPANPGPYRTHAQVESNQTKTTKAGSPFLELKFAAAEGSVTLRAWDNTPAFGQAAAALHVAAPEGARGAITPEAVRALMRGAAP